MIKVSARLDVACVSSQKQNGGLIVCTCADTCVSVDRHVRRPQWDRANASGRSPPRATSFVRTSNHWG
eukprot:817352-Alexandrium_andersonii.AAC.1